MKKNFLSECEEIGECIFNNLTEISKLQYFEPKEIEFICNYIKPSWNYVSGMNGRYLHIFKDNNNIGYFVFSIKGKFMIKEIIKNKCSAKYYEMIKPMYCVV